MVFIGYNWVSFAMFLKIYHFSAFQLKNFNVQCAGSECGIALQCEHTFQQNITFRVSKTRAFQRFTMQSLGPTPWQMITIAHLYDQIDYNFNLLWKNNSKIDFFGPWPVSIKTYIWWALDGCFDGHIIKIIFKLL